MTKQNLVTIHDNLSSSLVKQAEALPSGFNKQRFVQNCMTVLQDSKLDFSKCDPSSVVRTLLKGSFLGLDFLNGECYAIPYGDKIQFQTDYKGEIKLCKMYSRNPIKDIYAKVVKDGDVFAESVIDGKQSINFEPIPFNDGNVIGAFAVVYYHDGSMMYDSMSKKDIDHVRNVYSKASKSKAWTDSYNEMAKKTVLRRLCKLVDLHFDNAQQIQSFDDGSDFEFTEKTVECVVDDPLKNMTVADVKEVVDKSVDKSTETVEAEVEELGLPWTLELEVENA